MKSLSSLNQFEKIEKIISIIANIAIISGIIFALVQVVQSSRFEKRRIAIESLAILRSNGFLESYDNLLGSDPNIILFNSSLREDLNYVINVYDNIAILYLNGLADKNLIKRTIYPAIKQVVSILDSISYPKENRLNIDLLISELK